MYTEPCPGGRVWFLSKTQYFLLKFIQPNCIQQQSLQLFCFEIKKLNKPAKKSFQLMQPFVTYSSLGGDVYNW